MINSAFKFKDPVLTNLSFTLNKDFFKSRSEKEACNEVIMENGLTVNVTKEDDKNRAMVELIVKILPKNGAGPFTIEATMYSYFEWDASISDQVADQLTKINAPALLLGYLRPIIANVTNTPITPCYNLPFMDFTKDPVTDKISTE